MCKGRIAPRQTEVPEVLDPGLLVMQILTTVHELDLPISSPSDFAFSPQMKTATLTERPEVCSDSPTPAALLPGAKGCRRSPSDGEGRSQGSGAPRDEAA